VTLRTPHPLSPRDLKSRLEAAAAKLCGGASAATLEERALAAEGRARALAASLGRKEAALRDATAAAAAARAQLAQAQALGDGSAGDALAEARGAAVRLKAELARKDMALQVRMCHACCARLLLLRALQRWWRHSTLCHTPRRPLVVCNTHQAVTCDLERIKQQLAVATAAAAKQAAAVDGSLKRQTAHQRQRLAAACHALPSLARLLLSCMATMAAAAAALQQHASQQQQAALLRASVDSSLGSACTTLVPAPACEHQSGALVIAGMGAQQQAEEAGRCASLAAGLADMVCLTGDELADLLGPNDDTCRLLVGLQQQQAAQQDQRQAGAGGPRVMAALERAEGGCERAQQLLQQVNDAACALAARQGGAAGDADTGGSDAAPLSAATAQRRLQSVLAALTQDAGARQGALRTAVSLLQH
jgi:hypothetical protein